MLVQGNISKIFLCNIFSSACELWTNICSNLPSSVILCDCERVKSFLNIAYYSDLKIKQNKCMQNADNSFF